ncbi:hypothetical protein [Athalassotoga saccharophila]|uniref:hypothetical protein n=1 Tax=Athalassotoga saccharophila TaxID=1441386 RepID=UPI00137ABEBF|nr:hypothetical protein [Athalassotoga saccharophila]BBJ29016.1 hypothetical protein ATHSA_1941 [Athalassotoga saccharophila]
MKEGSLLIDAILAILIVFFGVLMIWSITSMTIAQSDFAVSMSRLNNFESYVSQYLLRQGISSSATALEASTPVINAQFFGTSKGATVYMRLVKITVYPTMTQASITIRPIKYEIIAGNVKRVDSVLVQGGY